jgi:hypothetical protein
LVILGDCGSPDPGSSLGPGLPTTNQILFSIPNSARNYFPKSG